MPNIILKVIICIRNAGVILLRVYYFPILSMILEKSAFSDVHLSYTLEKRKMPLVLLYVCGTKVTIM
jgi:hypothetical protein